MNECTSMQCVALVLTPRCCSAVHTECGSIRWTSTLRPASCVCSWATKRTRQKSGYDVCVACSHAGVGVQTAHGIHDMVFVVFPTISFCACILAWQWWCVLPSALIRRVLLLMHLLSSCICDVALFAPIHARTFLRTSTYCGVAWRGG